MEPEEFRAVAAMFAGFACGAPNLVPEDMLDHFNDCDPCRGAMLDERANCDGRNHERRNL